MDFNGHTCCWLTIRLVSSQSDNYVALPSKDEDGVDTVSMYAPEKSVVTGSDGISINPQFMQTFNQAIDLLIPKYEGLFVVIHSKRDRADRNQMGLALCDWMEKSRGVAALFYPQGKEDRRGMCATKQLANLVPEADRPSVVEWVNSCKKFIQAPKNSTEVITSDIAISYAPKTSDKPGAIAEFFGRSAFCFEIVSVPEDSDLFGFRPGAFLIVNAQNGINKKSPTCFRICVPENSLIVDSFGVDIRDQFVEILYKGIERTPDNVLLISLSYGENKAWRQSVAQSLTMFLEKHDKVALIYANGEFDPNAVCSAKLCELVNQIEKGQVPDDVYFTKQVASVVPKKKRRIIQDRLEQQSRIFESIFQNVTTPSLYPEGDDNEDIDPMHCLDHVEEWLNATRERLQESEPNELAVESSLRQMLFWTVKTRTQFLKNSNNSSVQ